MPSNEGYTSTQASGPEQWQLYLLAKIRERLAQAQHHLITHTPGDIVGLIDEAGAFFDTLAVSVPRPLIVSATVSLAPDRKEPLPRWLPEGDAGVRHE